jgi:ribose 1,5-bisphosphokinase PhnN
VPIEKQDIISDETFLNANIMSNPVIQAFFLGRAVAEVLKERLEDSLTSALSELGKFDAETRENLRQFTEEVRARAEREKTKGGQSGNIVTVDSSGKQSSVDLQETIDELRAEIARLRAELKNYRS